MPCTQDSSVEVWPLSQHPLECMQQCRAPNSSK
jgi:hypothetical protein